MVGDLEDGRVEIGYGEVEQVFLKGVKQGEAGHAEVALEFFAKVAREVWRVPMMDIVGEVVVACVIRCVGCRRFFHSMFVVVVFAAVTVAATASPFAALEIIREAQNAQTGDELHGFVAAHRRGSQVHGARSSAGVSHEEDEARVLDDEED